MMISFGNPNIFVKILGGRPMVAPTMLYDKLLNKLKFDYFIKNCLQAKGLQLPSPVGIIDNLCPL